MNNKSRIGLLIQSVIVMLLWGSLFPMIKLSYSALEMDTGKFQNLLLFAGLRFLVSGGIMTLICALRRRRMKLKGKSEVLRLFSVALFAVTFHYACTYTGLSMVDSGKTALLKQLGATLFICCSSMFFKEDRFTVGKLLAAILGLCGIAALNMESLRFSFGPGEMLILCASLCSVVAGVSSKRVTRTVEPMTLTGESQLIGGGLLTAVGLAGGGNLGTLHPKGLLLFSAIVLVSSVSYVMWYDAVSKAQLSGLFVIKFLEPLFAGIISSILLNESIWNLPYLLSLLLTLGAIAVSTWDPIKKKAGAAGE